MGCYLSSYWLEGRKDLLQQSQKERKDGRKDGRREGVKKRVNRYLRMTPEVVT